MSEDFQSRVASVFGSLRHSIKEEVINSPLKSDPEDKDYPINVKNIATRSNPNSKLAPVRTGCRHKRSNNNTIPDYIKNPIKWAKYSLKEDGSEQYSRLTSNQLNKQAALEFLSGLKSQHEASTVSDFHDAVETINDTNLCEHNKIVFKRRTHRIVDSGLNSSTKCHPQQQQEENDDKKQGKFIGGVYKMPEYSFGLKVSKKQSTSGPLPKSDDKTSKHKNTIQLGHLEEECDTE